MADELKQGDQVKNKKHGEGTVLKTDPKGVVVRFHENKAGDPVGLEMPIKESKLKLIAAEYDAAMQTESAWFKSPVTKEELKKAEELGKKAHQSGKITLPAQDPGLTQMIKPKGEGGSELSEAWRKGYKQSDRAGEPIAAAEEGEGRNLEDALKSMEEDFGPEDKWTDALFEDFDYWGAFEAGHIFANTPDAQAKIEQLKAGITDQKVFDQVFDSMVFTIPYAFPNFDMFDEEVKTEVKPNEAYFVDVFPEERGDLHEGGTRLAAYGFFPVNLDLVMKNFEKLTGAAPAKASAPVKSWDMNDETWYAEELKKEKAKQAPKDSENKDDKRLKSGVLASIIFAAGPEDVLFTPGDIRILDEDSILRDKGIRANAKAMGLSAEDAEAYKQLIYKMLESKSEESDKGVWDFHEKHPVTAASETDSNVYYVTLDGKDFEYPGNLGAAKQAGMNAHKKDPKGKVQIEVYTGKKHGSGGSLKEKLHLKDGKWVTASMAKKAKADCETKAASLPEDPIDSYLSTALWSSNDESDESGGSPMEDNYSSDDIAPETVATAKKDWEAFVAKAGALLDGLDLAQVAHDLWLTRNRHGAGFWDGDYEEGLGEKLTEIAQEMGEVNLYVGDDGKIHSDNEGDAMATVQATGEPDQDYDKAGFDAIVKALQEEGYEASHKEFDKYQGIYMDVSKAGKQLAKFWMEDFFVQGDSLPNKGKYKKAQLVDGEGNTYSANPGDYFMKNDSDVFEDMDLLLVEHDGTSETIHEPKKSDLPKDVSDSVEFKGEPDEVFVFGLEGSEGVQVPVMVNPEGDADVYEMVEVLKGLGPKKPGKKKAKSESEDGGDEGGAEETEAAPEGEGEKDWQKENREKQEGAKALFPETDELAESVQKIIDWDAQANAVSQYEEDSYDGDAKDGQDLELPYWLKEGWDKMLSDSDNSDLAELGKLVPELQTWMEEADNAKLSWGESGGMMPYGDANYPDDAVIVSIWGDDSEPEVQLDIKPLAEQLDIPAEKVEDFKKWLQLMGHRWITLKDYDGKAEYAYAYGRFQAVIATYFKLADFLAVAKPLVAKLDGEQKTKAEELLTAIEEGAGQH